ncbi:MAG: UV DNA damage repair endonuclease UvsE [Deltaproteobacteria bacterium]|jgi:UV DNA damage endonuclease|nr:UV DNA damage repair endonuclease UvsE [Deltaproteobacteria bacterium]
MAKKKIRKDQEKPGRVRLGLCCIFRDEPIRFRTTTAKYLQRFDRREQLRKLSGLCLQNTHNLLAALRFLQQNSIGAFRILSPFFPRFTHPDVGYRLADLPDAEAVLANLREVNRFRQLHKIRLSFHPDQFIILSSPNEAVVQNAINELEYQAMLAEHVGADVINIHGGGAYNDKKTALGRFRKNFERLSTAVKKRLALENDDRIYTVADLVPVCKDLQIPLVYDVHHHRCHPDGLTVEDATGLARRTWEKSVREPYFHISSPANGWQGRDPKPHADYIDPADFPDCWQGFFLTVDVEAKAKELAVMKLQQDLGKRIAQTNK